MMLSTSSAEFPKNDNLKALTFQFYYSNKLNLHFLEGSFEKGVIIVPKIIKGIIQFSNQIDPHHIMLFYYKIACVYFGVDDYENSII